MKGDRGAQQSPIHFQKTPVSNCLPVSSFILNIFPSNAGISIRLGLLTLTDVKYTQEKYDQMFEVSSKCAVSCPPREAQCKLLCFAEREKSWNIRQGIQRQFYHQCYAPLEHIAKGLEAFLLQPSTYLLFLNIKMPFYILNLPSWRL